LLYKLNHYSKLRNIFIHNQSVFEQSLDENNNIVLDLISLRDNDLVIKKKVVNDAIITYLNVSLLIYEVVVRQVLNNEDKEFHEVVNKLIGAIAE